MNFKLPTIPGGKTYAIGFAIIAYVVWCMVNGAEPDPAIVDMMLAGGLVTLRAGTQKAENAISDMRAPMPKV